jgi:hypothetical protein
LEQINKTNADRDAIFSPSDHALESEDISLNWPCTEREALFQFTSEEKSGRANSNSLMMNQQELLLIKEAFVHRK